MGCCLIHELLSKAHKIFEIYSVEVFFFSLAVRMAHNLSRGSSFPYPAKQPGRDSCPLGRTTGKLHSPRITTALCVCRHASPARVHTCVHTGSSPEGFAGVQRAVRGSRGPCLPAWGACSHRAHSPSAPLRTGSPCCCSSLGKWQEPLSSLWCGNFS